MSPMHVWDLGEGSSLTTKYLRHRLNMLEIRPKHNRILSYAADRNIYKKKMEKQKKEKKKGNSRAHL